MTARVQQIDGEFRIVLTPEMMQELRLTDGAEVAVLPAGHGANGKAETEISAAESVASYRRTTPLHSSSYRELAK